MFNLKENACVGFESRWKVKRVYSQNTTQTSEVSLKEIHTQTAVTTESQTQTEETNVSPEVDMQKLADWLNKIYPRVTKELNEANTCKAFKNYHPIPASGDASAKLLQELKVSSVSKEENALRLSALSWNSTGKTLAVSCNFLHKNWCHHNGLVKFFIITSDDQLSKKPVKTLSTETCVTVLEFHPTVPSIIAAGMFSGEIVVWNTQHDEGDCVVCKVNGHEEGVTQISWVNDVAVSKTLLLATSSLDGCLNMWNFSFASSSLTLKETYKIKAPVLGRVRQIEETPIEISAKAVRGIICFDFSRYVSDMFVVGVEGGLVVQCSMLGTNSLLGSTPEVPVSDPVFKYYEPHEGEIQSISFSPNRSEMFLSHGTNGEIRIYVLGQEEPAQVIFLEKPLINVFWVPYEETLLCGCGEKGVLEIFNVLKGRPIKNVTKDKLPPVSLTQMKLNNKRPTTVVTGTNNGLVLLWNVPWSLFALADK